MKREPARPSISSSPSAASPGASCLLLGAALALAGCMSMIQSVGGGMTDELRATGTLAAAEVLEIWDTGWTINDDPVIGMRVRVRPPDGPAYEATIEKTLVSRIATAQFQPGAIIPVRFDPQNPAIVAVEPDSPVPARASSGNPWRDGYVEQASLGGVLPPEGGDPRMFLGTGDSAADAQALYENHYILLGASAVPGPASLEGAVAQARDVGAAVIVLYGSFAEGRSLELLPYRPLPVTEAQAAALPSGWDDGLFSNLGGDGRVAAYWARSAPPILGVVFRPLDAAEANAHGRGVLVEAVTMGSPAAGAGIAAGDLIVAIDGREVDDPLAMPDFIRSIAGREVRIDLMRNGEPVEVMARLNPAAR